MTPAVEVTDTERFSSQFYSFNSCCVRNTFSHVIGARLHCLKLIRAKRSWSEREQTDPPCSAGSRQWRSSCSEHSMRLDCGTCNIRLHACCAPAPCWPGPGCPESYCLHRRWAQDAAGSCSWFLLAVLVSLILSSFLCQKPVFWKNCWQL